MSDFIVKHIDKIIYIIYCILVTISLTITAVKYAINKKKAKTAEEKEQARLELVNSIKKQIDSFMVDAEKLKNYKPEEKKQYVMTRAIQIAQGLLTNEEIDNYIESQIYLTDNINKHA